MDYANALSLFFVLLVGIIIIPGMDMLYVMANAMSGGRRFGLAATAGITAGGIVHTAFGTIGVGILAHWIPGLLPVILFAGAAYMAWIGFSLVRSTIVMSPVGPVALRPLPVVFGQGMITCLLNPKAYLFVFSVYPQFMKPQFGPIWRQALVLGLITACVQITIYGTAAFAAAWAGNRMAERPAVIIWSARIAGLLFILAAALLILEGPPATPPA